MAWISWVARLIAFAKQITLLCDRIAGMRDRPTSDVCDGDAR
jgi:hypothetical protein